MPSPKITTEGGNLIINGEVRGCMWLGGDTLHDDPELANLVAQLLSRYLNRHPAAASHPPFHRESLPEMPPNGLLDSPRFNTPPSGTQTQAVLFDGTIVDVYEDEVGITVEKVSSDARRDDIRAGDRVRVLRQPEPE